MRVTFQTVITATSDKVHFKGFKSLKYSTHFPLINILMMKMHETCHLIQSLEFI